MINFNDIKYERVNLEKTNIKINNLLKKINKTKNYDEYYKIIKSINNIQLHIEEMCDYADIKNMRNLNDEIYKKEMDYWNEYKPKLDTLFIPYYNEIKNSKYKKELKKAMPDIFFKMIEQNKLASEKNNELIKNEKELQGKYKDLNKTKILYDGEEKTIREIGAFCSDKDRKIRKKAHDAINDFYYKNKDEYNNILFELVKIRNKIAKNLGYKNYAEYSIYLLKRFGYDYTDISKFRNNVKEYIIPLCKKISNWQKEKLKLDKLEYYDTVLFEEMPKLKYTGIDLLNELRKPIKNIDKDLSKLYNDMLDNGYIDLVQRENKVNFNITNYLSKRGFPTITGNYRNQYSDVSSTMHEFGHSFQKYNASKEDKNYIVSPLLKYPTFEVAEIFSHAMELITMKYVGNIFNEEDYKKYCFMTVYEFVAYLPYICLVDEFQEKIYSKANLKQEDINNTWLELVKKYNLEKSNTGHINLESGNYFFRQSHIYLNPFYYIDYALSDFGAFSLWDECENNLDLFKKLGRVASYYSFKDLIDKYDMPNPFDKETVKNIAIKLENELEKYIN